MPGGKRTQTLSLCVLVLVFKFSYMFRNSSVYLLCIFLFFIICCFYRGLVYYIGLQAIAVQWTFMLYSAVTSGFGLCVRFVDFFFVLFYYLFYVLVTTRADFYCLSCGDILMKASVCGSVQLIFFVHLFLRFYCKVS